MENNLKAKLMEAENAVKRCLAAKGFYASSLNYAGQYWLRDLVFSLQTLLQLGYGEKVKAHLNLFVEAYRRRGEVPAVVFEHGTLTLIAASLRMLVKPSLLRAYPLSFALPNLFGRGLQTWTGDSAILLLIGLHEYSEASSDQSMLENFKEEALGLLQGLLKMAGQEGLLTGSGWMDAMANYVGQPNLVLQILFYKALRLYGFKAEAEGLKEQIQDCLLYTSPSPRDRG